MLQYIRERVFCLNEKCPSSIFFVTKTKLTSCASNLKPKYPHTSTTVMEGSYTPGSSESYISVSALVFMVSLLHLHIIFSGTTRGISVTAIKIAGKWQGCCGSSLDTIQYVVIKKKQNSLHQKPVATLPTQNYPR